MAEIKFERVCKSYGKVKIIENLDLEIRDREFLVLVGPSGCGKSTTLRMIAGLEDVSSGNLFIGDTRVNDLSPKDRNIAMVFQNYALYPHMSVRKNLEFSLVLRKTPRGEIDRQVKKVAKILGLTELLDRKPKELSGGQRQRVAMGRAIVRDPEVFLFDEPLSNLDAKLRVEMRVELAKLHKRLNTTIVYVTHDQVEAMTLADRIVVMNGGVIQQVGAPLDLYDKPINSFVGAFIGSPVMNQTPAQIGEEDGAVVISIDEVKLPLPQEMGSRLSSCVGKKILLGIRPESLAPCREANGKVALDVEVEVIEPMGGESYVYFSLCKKQWVAKCEGMPGVAEGDKAKMAIDLTKLHIFSEDGKTRLVDSLSGG